MVHNTSHNLHIEGTKNTDYACFQLMKRVKRKLFSEWGLKEGERSDAAALTCCIETTPQIATQKYCFIFIRNKWKLTIAIRWTKPAYMLSWKTTVVSCRLSSVSINMATKFFEPWCQI